MLNENSLNNISNIVVVVVFFFLVNGLNLLNFPLHAAFAYKILIKERITLTKLARNSRIAKHKTESYSLVQAMVDIFYQIKPPPFATICTKATLHAEETGGERAVTHNC